MNYRVSNLLLSLGFLLSACSIPTPWFLQSETITQRRGYLGPELSSNEIATIFESSGVQIKKVGSVDVTADGDQIDYVSLRPGTQRLFYSIRTKSNSQDSMISLTAKPGVRYLLQVEGADRAFPSVWIEDSASGEVVAGAKRSREAKRQEVVKESIKEIVVKKQISTDSRAQKQIAKNTVLQSSKKTVKDIEGVVQEPKVKPKATPSSSVETGKIVSPKKNAQTSVSGIVEIWDGSRRLSAANTMIVLEPIGRQVAGSRSDHKVDMKNKQFSPQYLSISVGDTVTYGNEDDFNHNVFSLTKGDSFDLGSYGANQSRKQTFTQAGVYKVYCNVHAEMASFVLVTNGGQSALLGADGSYSFRNVAAGEYELIAWNIRGETRERIKISSGESLEKGLKISASRSSSTKHLNKFGKPYKPSNGIELY